MNIEILSPLGSTCFDQEEVLSILTEEVLLKTDDEIKKSNSELEKSKNGLNQIRSEIRRQKDEYDKLIKTLSKEKILARVLDLINILQNEEVLIGKNKVMVQKILVDIDKKDFNYLRNLEEKLAVYLPDKYK
jgi:septal ring factor EnvC (AmiA/AmiB activator)